jgi:hypothetical protein
MAILPAQHCPHNAPAASGHGAIAMLFHVLRLGCAVPEPQRWEEAQDGEMLNIGYDQNAIEQ